jgi:hypothetical protein
VVCLWQQCEKEMALCTLMIVNENVVKVAKLTK